MARSSRSVSLRGLFPQAVFTVGEDIVAGSCSRSPKSRQAGVGNHVFVAGVDSLEADDAAVATAIKAGASAIITERLLPASIPQCIVGDARQAYSMLLHALAKNPSEKLITVGVLGTHGKTSVALLVASMLKSIGGGVAYWTSLGRNPEGPRKNSRLPSHGSAAIARWMLDAVNAKKPAAVIELSEEMLLNRTAAGVEFDILVIPSFRKTQRHDQLETRGIETGLIRAIEQLKDHGLVVYNADDARLNRFIERHQIPALSYGLDADANVRGKRIDRHNGSQTIMVSAGQCLMPLTTPLSGDHALRHALAAVTVGHAFGLELFEVIGGVERMSSIPGRMQSLQCGQDFHVTVDLADQADRLAVALHALAPLGGRIICVAEVPDCASAEQRAAYGRVLSRAASRVLLTQSRHSNLRGQKWMWEVLDGCDHPAAVDLVPDRKAAIELALRSAQPGDQILLAGWGTLSWTNNRERAMFNDKDVAEKLLYSLSKETMFQNTNAVAMKPPRLLQSDE